MIKHLTHFASELKRTSAFYVKINYLKIGLHAQTCSFVWEKPFFCWRTFLCVQRRLRSAEGERKMRGLVEQQEKALRETHSRLGRVCAEQWGVGREAALFKTSLISTLDQELQLRCSWRENDALRALKPPERKDAGSNPAATCSRCIRADLDRDKQQAVLLELAHCFF